MTRDVEARRNAVERPRKNTNTLVQRADEGEGLVIGEKISCHLHGSNRASTADSMEKNTEFPSKNVRKNSLLFFDGVYKNSIYVQKIHAYRSSAVPPLHLYIIVLRSSRTRKKRGRRRVRSAFAF